MKRERTYFILAAVLALLIVTNSSIKDFKDFVGVNTYAGLHKKRNFFVFSLFKNDRYHQEYIGVLGNLFKLNNDSTVAIHSATVDSVLVTDSPVVVSSSSDGTDLFESSDSVKSSAKIDEEIEEFIKTKKVKPYKP